MAFLGYCSPCVILENSIALETKDPFQDTFVPNFFVSVKSIMFKLYDV